MVVVVNTEEIMADSVVLGVGRVELDVVKTTDEFLMSIAVDIAVEVVEVVTSVDVLLVRVDVVLLLIIGVVVAPLCANLVCMRQRLSTTTASMGQHGELPHCMDIVADNFVQMPAFGAAFTMSYL